MLGVLLLATTSECGSTGAGTDGFEAVERDDSAIAADVETLRSELTNVLDRAGLESVSSAIDEIDLASLFEGREFTLLAPIDDAFLGVSADELADLLADPDALLALLRDHVVPTTLRTSDLASIPAVRTSGGRELDISSLADGTLVIGGATVVSADNTVGGGVVHTIDRLLISGEDG